MRGVIRPAFGDHIPLGQQLVTRDMQVWTASAECAQHLFESISVAHLRGSRIMVYVGVSEEMISGLDVALVVELLGHAADDVLVLFHRHGSPLSAILISTSCAQVGAACCALEV